jgi:predicted SprT family Zn-dependent metalloprotease
MDINMSKNNLDNIEKLGRELLDSNGLYDWKIDFCNAKQIRGKAILSKKKILISRIHALYEMDRDAIEDTILHEIAHALDYERRGLSNHDAHWKKIALSIGCIPKGSGHPESLSDFKRKQLCRWICKCPNCGKQDYRYSRRKLACRSCCDKYNNGSFSDLYQLIYYSNPDYIIL